MADAKLRIIISAVDETTGAIGSVENALKGLGAGATKLLAAAGIGLGVAEIGRAAVALGKMGDESALLEARSAALSGGIKTLTTNVKAMDLAVGSALTRDDMMADATKMLTSGVATTGKAMADLAEMAIRLGPAEETAQNKVEGFTRALQTGRATALIPYGFDLAALTQRQAELQAANSSLTDKQALANAVLEQGASRVKALRDANVPLVTSTEAMSVATNDLKDALGSLVAKPYTVVVQMITEGVKGITEEIEQAPIRQAEAALAMAKQESTAYMQVEAALLGVRDAEANLVNAQASGAEAMIRNAQAALAKAQADYEAAKATAEHGDQAVMLAEVLLEVARGTYDAEDAERAYTASMRGTEQAARDASAAIDQARIAKMLVAAQSMQESVGVNLDWMGPTDADIRNAWLKTYAERKQKETEAARQAASSYESAMRAAAEKVKGYITSAMDKAQGALQGLIGGPTDITAPGANGPFENLYRAADVAKLGAASPWAAKLGLDQGTAQQIVNDFQKGLITDQVKALIDMPGLVNEVKMAGLAERLKSQFVAEVAKAAGTGTTVVEAVMGISQNEQGEVTGGMFAGLDKLAPNFAASGAGFIDALIGGIEGKTKDLTDSVTNLVNKMLAAIDAAVSGYQGAGGSSGSTSPPSYQMGTLWAPGGWARVGERGPELVRLPRSSRVYPAEQSSRMLGSSQAWHVTINMAGGGDPARMAAAAEQGVRRAARALGAV